MPARSPGEAKTRAQCEPGYVKGHEPSGSPADPCRPVRPRARRGREPVEGAGLCCASSAKLFVPVLCTPPSRHAAARFDTLQTHHIYHGPKAALQTAPLPRR